MSWRILATYINQLLLRSYAYCYIFVMLGVAIPIVINLSVVMPNVVAPSGHLHEPPFVKELCLLLLFIILGVAIPIVVNLSVVMQNVVAPPGHLHAPLGCPPIWIIYSRKCRSTLWYHPRGQCCKTNFVRNLQIVIPSQSVCHW